MKDIIYLILMIAISVFALVYTAKTKATEIKEDDPS